ncbi:hypothetical protein EKE94_14055 [Mesobaculum littorinae]|uniref:Uncharacterized protein n=1 Tax=Mesobaculum littorinae TaxID=2486419 RepID=A0A438AG39_9RHOB|nr:hypothetical protein [Mesobaculum littorinae]RVV97648.1 hypothetical protein EKE94_14055 [Mesobaculum littorinae]
MLGAAGEKKEAPEAEFAAVEAPALEFPEDLATLYRAQVVALADTLSDPKMVHRASEILGGLIDRIVIRHEATAGHSAEIRGKPP